MLVGGEIMASVKEEVKRFDIQPSELEELKQLAKTKVFDKTDRLREYLQQDSVKNFNTMLLTRGFQKVAERDRFETLPVLTDETVAMEEVSEYFKACLENNKIPTIATMVAFLGISMAELYYWSKTPLKSGKILREAIEQCHAFLEDATIHDKVDVRLFGYLSTAYYNSLKENSQCTTFLTQDSATSESLQAIRNQLLTETDSNK